MVNIQLAQHQYITVWHGDFLKKLPYYQIEQSKRLAEIRLNDMQLLK